MLILHKELDITAYVSSMSWGGSKTEVARKLELKILNAPLDKNITPLEMGLADSVYLFDDDGQELFRGFITDREANSVTGVVTYTAYDLLFYATKNFATHNFKGKLAEEITKAVCADVEIPVGELAPTRYKQKLIAEKKSIYEIIMLAYTHAHQTMDKDYHAVAKKGKLCVEEIGSTICDVELTEDSNITSSSYKESINNMVNKVLIYDGKGKQVGSVQNDADLKYGIFQQLYTKEEGKDPTTTAKSMFNGVEKTFTLQCVNNNSAVTGAGAIIKDSTTGLKGLVWIDSDTHTWSNGVATMSLTVTLKKIMDTKEGDVSTAEEVTAKTTNNTTNTATSPYGSKDNPPFTILNSSYGVVRANIQHWNEAYGYYSANGGSGKGWMIMDHNNKRVNV